MASHQVIGKYLLLWHELYPTRPLTDQTADAWAVALADVPDPAFEWAADRLTREQGRTYFPTPNEVRSHLGPSSFAEPRGLLGDGDAASDAIGAWYAARSAQSKRVRPEEASA